MVDFFHADVDSGSFVWNLQKEEENKRVHGVAFDEAAKAFADSGRLIVNDPGHSELEERHFCIGKVNERILTVRFTYRDGHIRIFGAGYWRKGRRLYEQKNH